jgi:hypothetical protein
VGRLMGQHARRWRLPAVTLILVCATGCLPRDRFNKNCEWSGDVSRSLNLSDMRDREHLGVDAQLAEELAQRYSDFKHKERSGYEGHGGYLQNGQVTRGCMDRMFGEIERAHGVTREQVFAARFYRDWRFDLAVLLSFVVFYVIGSAAMCRLLARVVGHHGSRFWVIAVGVSAIVVALLGIELLGVWATTAEMIRVGNDHIGASRAAKSPWFNPWGRHFWELLVAGSLVFSTIAWLRGLAWRESARPARGPQPITLH